MMKFFDSDSGFSRFMNTLFDVLYVGILWMVCSLPIITAGASATAAYYAMSKCVRHKTGYIGREFFHSFKENFRQITPLTVLFWFVAAVLFVDLYYVWTHESGIINALFVVLAFIAFVVAGIAVYSCPILSRFHKKNTELIKTSIYVLFRYLPLTIAIELGFIVSCIVFLLVPWAVLVIPGGYLYALSFPMERILAKMMPAVDENSEEAQKWYYRSSQNQNDS